MSVGDSLHVQIQNLNQEKTISHRCIAASGMRNGTSVDNSIADFVTVFEIDYSMTVRRCWRQSFDMDDIP